MNFLAHLYLSGTNPEVRVGNFMGDFVKGQNFSAFSSDIIKGIKLHRTIDDFTDSHAVVARSKNRIKHKYRHYSGVIIDIFYDHFLAFNWEKYSENSLNAFADDCYALVEDHIDVLPGRARKVFPYMVQNNWLVGYASLSGIKSTLHGMARRTPFESNMEHSIHDLEENYHDFQEDFFDFFPDIIKHTSQFLKNKQNS
ncbi:MAG: ACP phosphodiesterase [Cyclobacteriaceae bacterium]|nr:ACP phosphodiesterase [Cyclobacteriaceae bacterium]